MTRLLLIRHAESEWNAQKKWQGRADPPLSETGRLECQEDTIEKNANLIGKATTTFVAGTNGLRVAPFVLFSTLRVQSVTGEGGQPLAFIQEDKKDDADFFVILPRPLAAGEKYTITTLYSGKEAITNEGNGNYFPVARHTVVPRVG